MVIFAYLLMWIHTISAETPPFSGRAACVLIDIMVILRKSVQRCIIFPLNHSDWLNLTHFLVEPLTTLMFSQIIKLA